MTNRIFVIIGASGFIGQHLAKKFSMNNIPVTCYSRSPVLQKFPGHTYIVVNSYEELDFSKDSIIYHLAETHHIQEVEEYGKKYVEKVSALTQKILSRNFKHLIYASSTTVYDDTLKFPLAPDNRYIRPKSIYAESKVLVEELVSKRKSTIVRITNTYGSGMSKLNIFNDIMTQINNPEIFLRESTPVRDYIYIDDLTDAMMLIGTRESEGIYNIGSGTSYSCDDLCKTFLTAANKTEKTVTYTKNPRISSIQLDISKTISDLAWKPHYSLSLGIKDLLEKCN